VIPRLLACAIAVLTFVPASARAQEQLGFRIRSWVDWEDQRIEGGRAFVGGPYGLAFTLKVRFEDTYFEIRIRPYVTADSTQYYAWVQTRQPAPSDDSGRALVRFDAYHRMVAVGRAQAALFALPVEPEPGESATLRIQIDGPFARPLEGRRPWSERDAEEPRGVRVSVAGARPRLEVVPVVIPGSVALRISRDGSTEAIRVLAGAYAIRDFAIPGAATRWLLHENPSGSSVPQRCFVLFRAPPPGRPYGQFTPEDRAQWCILDSERWVPVLVTSENGLRLRVQEIP